MAGADVLDALDQDVEVACQLRRVRVVDVIQIDLDRTQAVARQIASQFAGQVAHIGVVEQQQAAEAGQRLPVHAVAALLADIGFVRTAFQVEAERHAQLRGNGVAGAVIGGIRPHHGARRFVQMRHDGVAAMAQIGLDALAIIRFALIALACLPTTGDRCRGLVAEWIAGDTFVQIVAVRADFDQAAVLHLAQLCPGDEIIVGEIAMAIGHHLAGRQFDPAGDRCDQRGVAIGLQ